MVNVFFSIAFFPPQIRSCICMGTMLLSMRGTTEMDWHFHVQVNWTKFFDASLLATAFITIGSIAVSFLL